MADPHPHETLRLTRHGGDRVWGGWLFLGLASVVLAHRQVGGVEDASERLALLLVSIIFGAVGGLVVIRRYEQTISISPHQRRILIADSTRFGTRVRTVPFAQVIGLPAPPTNPPGHRELSTSAMIASGATSQA